VKAPLSQHALWPQLNTFGFCPDRLPDTRVDKARVSDGPVHNRGPRLSHPLLFQEVTIRYRCLMQRPVTAVHQTSIHQTNPKTHRHQTNP